VKKYGKLLNSCPHYNIFDWMIVENMFVSKQIREGIPRYVPPHKVGVVDPLKEKKSNENIKEKSLEATARHNDSENTSKVKDKTFRETHEILKNNINIKQFYALRVKKIRFIVREEYQVERRATILCPTHQMDDETEVELND
jgi:hypothetical protein